MTEQIKAHENYDTLFLRESFKSFISQTDEFKNYDFDGAGLKEIIRILSYSDQNSAPGVSKISSLELLHQVDLIIWSHVMEHVAEPYEELEKLLKHSKYIYVEVPYGVPKPSKSRRSVFLQYISLLISLNPTTYSRFTRPSAGRVSSRAFIKQSEHMSFYTEQTFEVIGELLGVLTQTTVATSPTPDGAEAKILRVFYSRSTIFGT